MDWQAFQAFVGAIQEDLLPGFVVESVEYETDRRGIRRQLDAVLRNRDAPYTIRVMVEATTRSSKVSLEEMEAFVGKARNLNCQKMVVVSSTGFTGPALTAAADAGVEAWVLREVNAADLEGTIGRIGIRVNIEVPRSHSFKLAFKGRLPPGFQSRFDASDRDRLMVYTGSGDVRGNLWDFVQANKDREGTHVLPVEPGDFMLIGGEKYGIRTFEFVTDIGTINSDFEVDLDKGLLAVYENAQDPSQQRFIRWREGLPASFETPE